ncbi:MAB_1171c family putative transporter [Actinoplanes sp. NPDC026623]|uniref:MAB_1171c family putative transporter n=1 Tax=Actinoplanes sp. NPDC026623 TaxID=3155610 RepID=UPI003405D6E7
MNPTINDILYPIAAALAGMAMLFKLIGLRKNRDAASVTLCLSFGLLAIIFALSTPSVWAAFDRALGVPNLAALVTQSIVIADSAALQALMLFWMYPRTQAWRKIRFRATLLTGVLLVMSALFLMTPAATERTRDFVATHAHLPTYSLYLLVYLAAYTITRIDILRMSWRYAPVAGAPWLRRGLRIFGLGAICGLFYAAARITDVVAAVVGWDPSRWENVARLGASIGAIVTIVGLTIPGWGPNLSRVAEWFGSQRAYRQLYPLWSALHRAVPGIALDPPSRNEWLYRYAVRAVKFKLTRRAVEIRDGRLALRDHFDARVESAARQAAAERNLDDSQLSTVVEAAVLAGAVRAMQRDELPVEPVLLDVDGDGDRTDMATEVKWLVEVSLAFDRSPVVAAALAADAPQSAPQAA